MFTTMHVAWVERHNHAWCFVACGSRPSTAVHTITSHRAPTTAARTPHPPLLGAHMSHHVRRRCSGKVSARGVRGITHVDKLRRSKKAIFSCGNVHNHTRRLGREAQSCMVFCLQPRTSLGQRVTIVHSAWLHVDRVTHVDRLRRSKKASPAASAVFMLVIPLHKECREHTTAMTCEKNVSACSAACMCRCMRAQRWRPSHMGLH
jgi:hypothetical protein